MIKIWKYEVPGHCEGHIRQVLNVKTQYGRPVVWVSLDDELPYRSVDFYKVRTGWEIKDSDAEMMKNSAYIGSVKDDEGKVWHCYCIATQPNNPPKEENKEGENAAAGNAIAEPANAG